jgi:hypothetical protein
MRPDPFEVSGVAGVPDYTVIRLAEPSNRHALIIPVIDEGDRIRRQLAAIKEASPPVDVYLADGGSTDGTTGPWIEDAGLTALLIKTGPRMALHHTLPLGYEGILTMDGNCKDGVEGIDRIVEALDAGFDFVQGSRFIRGGTAEHTPLSRLLGIKLVHAPVTSLAARHRLTDTTSAFRGHARAFLTDPRTDLFRDVFDTYELLAYLPIRAGRLGYRLTEVPVARRYPPHGKTPTRIVGLRANARLLRIVLEAALGHYDPGTVPGRQGG